MHRFERPNYSEISREDAIERIRQLEDEAGMAFQSHPYHGFTEMEDCMLGAIAAAPHIATRERIYTLLYGMHEDPPNQKILDVYLSKLRKKLTPYEIKIETVWGRGYYMSPDDRLKLESLRFKVAA